MRRLVVLLALAGVLVAGCGSSTHPDGSGFALDGDLLRQPAAPPPPDDPWLTRVATARPEVTEVIASGEPPPHVELVADRQPSTAQSGAELTPIPSEELSWDSTAVLGGWSFSNPTKIGSPRVFVVTADHGDWLEVMVPVRPNHQRGWIRSADVIITEHRTHAEIDVTTNTLRVWDGDDLIIETATIDGAPSTPTPLGRFYFNELQQVDPGSAYGSYIISTNGYSDSLDRFSGEVPIFAVHGTNNPGAIPSDRSNGCIRIPNDVVERIAAEVPMGTPVEVVAS